MTTKRSTLLDALAEGTGTGEAIWRELLADASLESLEDIKATSDRHRREGWTADTLEDTEDDRF